MMMRSGWSRARTFLATLSVPFRGLQVITGAFPSGRNRSGEDDRDSSPHSAIERTEQLDGKEADANTHDDAHPRAGPVAWLHINPLH